MKADTDERRLASLVLLLRPPPNRAAAGDDDDDGGDDAASSSSPVPPTRDALEDDGCDLLRFVTRLVRHYCRHETTATTVSPPSKKDDVDGKDRSAPYAYLRLAVRVAFLRYAPSSSSSSSSSSSVRPSDDDGDGLPRECETRLLDSLLDAIRARSSSRCRAIGEVDPEIAWASLGLLSRVGLGGSASSDDDGARCWTDAIDALSERRRPRPRNGGAAAAATDDGKSDDPADDERLMVETIHSILDSRGGGASSSSSSDRIRRDDDDEGGVGDDWTFQYDISLLSCVKSLLRTAVDDDGEGDDGTGRRRRRRTMPKLTHNALFELIRWSQEQRQQDTELSADVYATVLRYLHLFVLGFKGGTMHRLRSHCTVATTTTTLWKGGSVAAIDDDGSPVDSGDDGAGGDFAAAVRSFVFHGLLILANSVPASRDATKDDDVRGRRNSDSPPSLVSDGRSDMSTMRGDIYSLAAGLWQLCGIDWLLVPESTLSAAAAAAIAASSWWWFPPGREIGDERHSLGPIWPLCTLVRMAAGEYRIGLGRLITLFEDGFDSAASSSSGGVGSTSLSCLVSEVNSCARIITEAVRLMTGIADDDDDDAGATSPSVAWSPDAILHIRISVEDALNSSVQYSNAMLSEYDVHSLGQRPATDNLTRERVEVGRICCLVMGTIAAELEVDHLLAPQGADILHTAPDKTQNDEMNHPSFARALRGGILFCHSLGERRHGRSIHERVALGQSSYYEYHEPLTYLLPCVMSIVANSIAYRGESESNAVEALSFAIDALRKDDCLMLAMSGFLHRTCYTWRHVCKGTGPLYQIDDSTIQGTDSTISALKLCILIVIEFTSIETSSAQVDRMPKLSSKEVCLRPSLDLWKENLARINGWPCQTLRSSAASALDLISHYFLDNE